MVVNFFAMSPPKYFPLEPPLLFYTIMVSNTAENVRNNLGVDHHSTDGRGKTEREDVANSLYAPRRPASCPTSPSHASPQRHHLCHHIVTNIIYGGGSDEDADDVDEEER